MVAGVGITVAGIVIDVAVAGGKVVGEGAGEVVVELIASVAASPQPTIVRN